VRIKRFVGLVAWLSFVVAAQAATSGEDQYWLSTTSPNVPAAMGYKQEECTKDCPVFFTLTGNPTISIDVDTQSASHNQSRVTPPR
jgi:hypothetical protein